MTKTGFMLMSLAFKIRDRFNPPKKILDETGIRPGFHVLDYGCGPGSFSIAASSMVGDSGRVYSADVSPDAIDRITALSKKNNLENIKTIRTELDTGLENESLNLILLYDVFHHIRDKKTLLTELHRILKPGHSLSFSDHHMKEKEIINEMEQDGLFVIEKKAKKIFRFKKVET